MNKRKVAFVVDGWYSQCAMKARGTPFRSGEDIKNYCAQHLEEGDYLYRIYYYDTPPLDMSAVHPLTGVRKDYSQTRISEDQYDLLASLRQTSYVTLRLGRTIWRGWKIDKARCLDLLNGRINVSHLKEHDVNPDAKQKSVDMMIGMDIAQLALKNQVDVIIIISGDSDMAPAARLARNEGVQVILDHLHDIPQIPADLLESVDEVRSFAHEMKPQKPKSLVKIIKEAG